MADLFLNLSNNGVYVGLNIRNNYLRVEIGGNDIFSDYIPKTAVDAILDGINLNTEKLFIQLLDSDFCSSVNFDTNYCTISKAGENIYIDYISNEQKEILLTHTKNNDVYRLGMAFKKIAGI